MTITDSIKYVKGWNATINNDENVPHYFIELTEAHLENFEILNSLCTLNNYESLLTYIESQLDNAVVIGSDKSLLVPPIDVWVILLTLATVTTISKNELLSENDPYNVSRIPLNKRAVKLLSIYNEILKNFNTDEFNRYDLELLRCQLFLTIESIIPQRSEFIRATRKTRFGNKFQNNIIFEELKNPYRSYKDSLKQNDNVLGNKMLNRKLTQHGQLIDTILSTLSNSLCNPSQDNESLFLNAQESWMPLINFILDLILMRQNYFVENEIAINGSKVSATKYTQQLMKSPVARFLSIIDSYNFSKRFAEYIFINCYDHSDHSFGHDPFNGSNNIQVSNIFVPRICYPLEYRIGNAMELRRKLINICFHLLSVVPEGHKLLLRGIETEYLVKNLTAELCNFTDLKYFQIFLFTEHFKRDIIFLPLLAEEILNDLINNNIKFFDFPFLQSSMDEGGDPNHKNKKEHERMIQYNFVDNIDDIEKSINKYSHILNHLMILDDDLGTDSREQKQQEYNIKMKCLFCVLSFYRFTSFFHSRKTLLGHINILRNFSYSFETLEANFTECAMKYNFEMQYVNLVRVIKNDLLPNETYFDDHYNFPENLSD